MNPFPSNTQVAQADVATMALLNQIDTATSSLLLETTGDSASAAPQQRGNQLLAHIAWSRLAEPGDGAAGAFIAAVGAEAALQLLVQQTSATQLVRILSRQGHEISPKTAKEAIDRWVPRLNRSATLHDIEQAAASGLQVILPGDSLWPTALDDLGLHRPTMLWVRGNPGAIATPSLSVVGARAATGYGSHMTAEIVGAVSVSDLAIVSGAAYGIDAVAHRTALATQRTTVAVLAGGADRPYPRAHDSLLQKIAHTGAVCSEMIPGAAPTKWRFLMRNRLIAALSRATIITEAGIHSGSLNTAGHAAQLGRPIGAVPGPVTSAASAGCHKLIRDYSAVLVTNAQQVLELVGQHENLGLFEDAETDAREGAWERRVLDALPLRGARGAADIAGRAGLGLEQVRGVLAELELLKRVQRRDSPGGESTQWALLR